MPAPKHGRTTPIPQASAPVIPSPCLALALSRCLVNKNIDRLVTPSCVVCVVRAWQVKKQVETWHGLSTPVANDKSVADGLASALKALPESNTAVPKDTANRLQTMTQ